MKAQKVYEFKRGKNVRDSLGLGEFNNPEEADYSELGKEFAELRYNMTIPKPGKIGPGPFHIYFHPTDLRILGIMSQDAKLAYIISDEKVYDVTYRTRHGIKKKRLAWNPSIPDRMTRSAYFGAEYVDDPIHVNQFIHEVVTGDRTPIYEFKRGRDVKASLGLGMRQKIALGEWGDQIKEWMDSEDYEGIWYEHLHDNYHYNKDEVLKRIDKILEWEYDIEDFDDRKKAATEVYDYIYENFDEFVERFSDYYVGDFSLESHPFPAEEQWTAGEIPVEQPIPAEYADVLEDRDFMVYAEDGQIEDVYIQGSGGIHVRMNKGDLSEVLDKYKRGEINEFKRGQDVKASLGVGKKIQIEKWFEEWAPDAKYTIGRDLSVHVKGNLDLMNTSVTHLPDGLHVDGGLDLENTPTTRLPDDLYVGEWLSLKNTPITHLPDGLRVGGWLSLENTPITHLPDGLRVGGWLDLQGTPIKQLPDGLRVGGYLVIIGTGLARLTDEQIWSRAEIVRDIIRR